MAATAPLEVYRTAVGGIDVSLFRLSLLLTVGALVVTAYGQRSKLAGWLSHPLVLAYLFLAAMLLLAMLAHPINRSLGVREAAQIATGVLALATIGELARRASVVRLADAIIVGSFLPILGAAWQTLAPKMGLSGQLPFLSQLPAARGLEVTRQAISSFGPIGARAKGTFGDPNHFGVYLVFVVFLAAAQALVSKRRGDTRAELFFGAMAIAAVAMLIASFSRSAWIATLIGGVIVAVTVVKSWRTWMVHAPRTLVATAVTVGALALSAAVLPSVAERVAPSSTINVVSDRSHERTVRFAFNQFIAHPVLGIGPGGLGVKLHEGSRTSGAHSTYLTVAAELGIIGLLALLIALGTAVGLLVAAYRSLQEMGLQVLALAMTAAYAGFLAANVTYDLGFDDFHWLMLGAVAAIAAAAGTARQRETAAIRGVDLPSLPRRIGDATGMSRLFAPRRRA